MQHCFDSSIRNAISAHYTYPLCSFAEADNADAAPSRKGDAEFERQLAMALMATEHQASAPAGPGISLDRTAIVEVRCYEGFIAWINPSHNTLCVRNPLMRFSSMKSYFDFMIYNQY